MRRWKVLKVRTSSKTHVGEGQASPGVTGASKPFGNLPFDVGRLTYSTCAL